jgi:hypothetical protein
VILLSTYPIAVAVVKPVLFATLRAKDVIHPSFFVARCVRSYPDLIQLRRIIVAIEPRAYDIVRTAASDRAPTAFVAVNDFLLITGMLPLGAPPNWHRAHPGLRLGTD